MFKRKMRVEKDVSVEIEHVEVRMRYSFEFL